MSEKVETTMTKSGVYLGWRKSEPMWQNKGTSIKGNMVHGNSVPTSLYSLDGFSLPGVTLSKEDLVTKSREAGKTDY